MSDPRALARERSTLLGRDQGAAAVLALASFIVSFDLTAVVVAMPTIKAELALSVSGFAWVMDAYSLAFVVLLTSAGVLADRYGRRRILLWGNALFAISSLACGLATSEAMLYGARAAQGVASAFVICGCLALLSDRFREPAQRGRAFALVGTVTGAAMALGPAGGGLVTEFAGWRTVFLINIPICLAIALAVPRVAEESRDPQARAIDYPGVLALSVALTSFVWLLLHGPEVGGLEIPLPVAMLVPVAATGAFVATQVLGKAPFLDLGLFRERGFLGMCLVPVALSLGYWALLVYLPLFLETGLGIGLAHVSWAMLAATAPMLVLPFLGARLLIRLTARWFFTGGLVCVGAGCLVLAGAALVGSFPLALAGMLVCGAAAAMLNAQVSSVIMTFALEGRTGTVSAIATILRQASFAIGIAIVGAILQATGAGAAIAVAEPERFAAPFAAAGLSAIAAALAVAALLRRRGAAAIA